MLLLILFLRISCFPRGSSPSTRTKTAMVPSRRYCNPCVFDVREGEEKYLLTLFQFLTFVTSSTGTFQGFQRSGRVAATPIFTIHNFCFIPHASLLILLSIPCSNRDWNLKYWPWYNPRRSSLHLSAHDITWYAIILRVVKVYRKSLFSWDTNPRRWYKSPLTYKEKDNLFLPVNCFCNLQEDVYLKTK